MLYINDSFAFRKSAQKIISAYAFSCQISVALRQVREALKCSRYK